MSDLNSLPVAPEFAEVLTENAVDTLLDYLKDANAPQSIIELTRNIETLGYYLAECFRSPEHLLKDRKDRLDIETVVVETINNIGVCGGMFYGPNGSSQPRKTHVSMKVRK